MPCGLTSAELAERLGAAVGRSAVPGASLAVWAGGEVAEATCGVTSLADRELVTPQVAFEIGSLAKLFTAAMVLAEVEAGKVALDDPVRRHVPEFRLADEQAADAITVRHLLAHASGLPGDHNFDPGPGDDALTRYVSSLGSCDPIHPPGAFYSYCNAGYGLAGRLLEVIAGEPFDVQLDRFLDGFGIGADEHRLRAVGHVDDGRGGRKTVGAWITTAHRPFGALMWATAGQMVAFAAAAGGLDASPTPAISPWVSSSMAEAQLDYLPCVPGSREAKVGLGWLDARRSGRSVLRFAGATPGCVSFLQVVPDSNLAVCLLANSPGGAHVWDELTGHLDALLKLPEPAVVTPGQSPSAADLARMAGRYERPNVTTHVEVEEDHLKVTNILHRTVRGMRGTTPAVVYRAVSPAAYIGEDGRLANFLDLPGGSGDVGWMHVGRAARRV